jgi:hypothetical protein
MKRRFLLNLQPIKDAEKRDPRSGEYGIRAASDGFHHIALVDTPYHVNGPVPGRLPEGLFRAGTRVQVLEQADGHVRVETEDGVRSRVASDVLACTQ